MLTSSARPPTFLSVPPSPDHSRDTPLRPLHPAFTVLFTTLASVALDGWSQVFKLITITYYFHVYHYTCLHLLHTHTSCPASTDFHFGVFFFIVLLFNWKKTCGSTSPPLSLKSVIGISHISPNKNSCCNTVQYRHNKSLPTNPLSNYWLQDHFPHIPIELWRYSFCFFDDLL